MTYAAGGHGLVLASRGDALTPHLAEALGRRYLMSGRLTPDLGPAQRLLVAGTTFRPTRSRWAERYFKSGLGYRLRSGNAARQWSRVPDADPVLQVHALFELPGATTAMYVDCTHRQSADLWPDWNPLRGKALERWYRAETRAYQQAEHLFAFSSWTRRSLTHDYGVDPDRVSVVGVGANVVHAGRAARPESAAPTILMVGNDFVRKGGVVLLEAFDAVRASVPDVRLVLVGTLPPVAVPAGVEVVGRVHDPRQLARFFEDADVFAMPSLFDPMPLAVLEAMGCGLPVVATRVCGIPDEVEDGVTGHLVEPGDAGGLARALVRVLDQPGRGAALGLAGQSRVREAFLWEHVVDRMSPVLDRLVGRVGAPEPDGRTGSAQQLS